MGQGLPTAQQIREIPAALAAAVTGREIDNNGHMNVVHYLALGSQAADVLMRELGVDDSYREDRRLGVFTAEHHLVYYSELREGDPFTVHVRVLERSDKAMHLMAFLVDDKRDKLSNTLEIMLVHVDLDERRASPLPGDLAAALDRKIADDGALTWPAPTCGSLRIRR
ncbi:thioesterase family protein [Nocardia flavorosea]|uniref:Thioesterase n=1 Tax=Nocardia flavorosea TaxID=53429 RepID=A0A846Y7P7_9NOCA|nr:thioesterase family protein [Nocardia flavorosea]NKY55203.1 thioesterase [Nocardia flavorosea]